MFYGEYQHTVDAKGRLFIPSKLRERLGDEFVIARGLDKCISVYPIEEWERFTEKLGELPMAEERRIVRYFNSGATFANLDAQGRVTIPPKYRALVGIEKDAMVIGNRTHLEIWSVDAWAEEQKFFDNDDITNELIKLGF